jgi:hypothetical protein
MALVTLVVNLLAALHVLAMVVCCWVQNADCALCFVFGFSSTVWSLAVLFY